MRERLYHIIDGGNCATRISNLYDFVMISTIVVCLIPLASKDYHLWFHFIDRVSVTIFIVDYLLRWSTADFKLRKGARSFLLYPFTVLAIIDLLAIVPSLGVLNHSVIALRSLRFTRTMRVFLVFKLLRYSRNFDIILTVLKTQREPLIAVCALSIAYIFVSALIVFNVEPQTFETFFDAIYWATVSLTTVGYGDIYPVTTPGRVVTIISSLIGIAIIALPAGIITAGYMEHVKKEKGDPWDHHS